MLASTLNNLSPPVIAGIVVVAVLVIMGLMNKVADWGGDRTRGQAEVGRGVQRLGVLIVGGLIVFALTKQSGGSSDIKLQGSLGYTFNWPMVELRAEKVVNKGSGESQRMRMGLYASPRPYDGTGTDDWEKIAAYEFPQILKTGEYWENVRESVPGKQPAGGTWYIILTVEEFDAAKDQWTLRDHLNFDEVRKFYSDAMEGM